MRLHVVEREPEQDPDAARRRPPIVLLHGLFGRARNLGFFQRRLAAGRRTLAIDLRNHGDSPHGQMDYVSLSFDLMETLAERDALPATLVGHSMGGKAAMTLALNRPEAVHSLVVADIPPAITGHGSSQLGRQLLRIRFPGTLDRSGADALLAEAIPDRELRQLMLQNLRLGADPGWQIGLREIVASMINIEGWPYIPEGHAYAGPTLFLAGGRSPYIQPKHHPVMRRLFPAHRMEVIEHAGHWLHAEEPARFATLLEAFCATY